MSLRINRTEGGEEHLQEVAYKSEMATDGRRERPQQTTTAASEGAKSVEARTIKYVGSQLLAVVGEEAEDSLITVCLDLFAPFYFAR